MDDDRLANGKYFGKGYFKELLERVRSIRASERKIYQQITDIFAECSYDYDKNAPDGRVLKSDVTVAKNYLKEDEIKRLERAIGAYFDYIERIIENRQKLSMQDISDSVNKFLEFNEYQILEGKGKVSHQQAKAKAIKAYEVFNKTQKIESDFDKEIKKLLNQKS